MINNILFGTSKKAVKLSVMYVRDDNSGNCMIGHLTEKELLIEATVWIDAILSHEELHKVINRLEGRKASKGIDKICTKNDWQYVDSTGICFKE